jgi:type II secretory pathway component PulC
MLKEITAPLLTTEWGQRFGFFLAVLFGILLAGTFLKLFLNVSHKNISPQSTPILVLKDQTMSLIEHIPQRHLFGNTGETQSTLPIARLPFALIGIMQSTSKNNSSAIISEAGETGKLYQTGDMLSSNIKISEIKSSGVIVNNNNHLEKLPLQRSPLVFQEIPQKSF